VNVDYEVVIIGGGVAGATAALFAARHGRSAACIDGSIAGGQLLSISKIEDFPGFADGVAGFELCPTLQEQAMNAGAEFHTGEVESVAPGDDGWTVTTAEGALVAGAVIVASGSTPRRLGVAGEERLLGHGISHCASCDGPIYREATVVVVGAGDSALQEALELAEYAGQVVLVHRGRQLEAQETYSRRVQETAAITIRYGTVVEEILGDERLQGVRIRDLDSGAVEELEAGALFPYVGSVGRTAFLGDRVPLDENGRIWTDALMRTELPGLFAAGDVRRESAAQAITVAGDGATAAVSAHRFLRDGAWTTAPAAAVAAGA
jgi:thioredoxin reductase (NADPH)